MAATRQVRLWRRIAVTVVVILGLVVAADRIGNYIAERAAAKTIQSSQHLSSRPDVDIGGFPFLTQLAAGEFGKVTITAHDVPVGDNGHLLDLAQLRVELHTVTVARDFDSVRAATASAAATADYDALSKALGVPISYASTGRVKATKSVTVAGRTLQASITTRPVLSGNTLIFTDTSIANLGQLGSAAGVALDQVFALDIPLSDVPFEVRATGLQVDAAGVQLDLAGSDLSFS